MLQELRFLYKEDLMCREFYEYYRTHRKKVVEPIDQYKLFVKAVGGLMMTLKKQIRETEGGVYIKGLGYFCHVKNTEKRRKAVGKAEKERSYFDRIKKVDTYSYWFFPDTAFKDWYIFGESPTKKDAEKKYKIHFDGIQSYYDAKYLAGNLYNFHGKQIKY